MGGEGEGGLERRGSRRESAARWSVAHPAEARDPLPRQLAPGRAFRRFLRKARGGRGSGGGRVGGAAETQQEDQVVFVNRRKENAGFAKNKFVTSRYTALTFVPKNLFEQARRVANSYFILITVFQLVPGVSPFPLYITVVPLVIILGIVMVKEGYEDVLRHISDGKVNSEGVIVLNEEDGETRQIKSEQVCVGDIIAVDRDRVCAADIVVLATEHFGNNAGSEMCWVDTANLDGETRLKVRRAVDLHSFLPELESGEQPRPEDLVKFQSVVTSVAPNPFLEAFSGRLDEVDGEGVVQLERENMIVRGAVLRNTKRAWGVVVGAGPTSKLRLNQQLPQFKFGLLERQLNAALGIVFAFQTIMCAGLATAAVSTQATFFEDYGWGFGDPDGNLAKDWVFYFLTQFILFSFLVPMSLYVILEGGKLMGGLYIHWDKSMQARDGSKRPAKANTTSLVEELGVIEYILSDKTGTLTDNEMRFTHCATAKSMYEVVRQDDGTTSMFKYAFGQHPARRSMVMSHNPHGVDARGARRSLASSKDKDLALLLQIMALCNDLEVEPDSEEGVFEYSGESPDEVALTEVAQDLGVVLEARTPAKVRVTVQGDVHEYALLAVLPFSSSRKRMGVVVHRTGASEVQVLFKGADNVMFEVFAGRHDVADLANQVDDLSRLGLRTLVLGAASMDANAPELQSFLEAYQEANLSMENRDDEVGRSFEPLEALLRPVGCTGVEDKLSEGVADALQSLVRANIQVAVLTGDKTETAMSICTTCGLFKDGSKFHKLVEPDRNELETYLRNELAKDVWLGNDSTSGVSLSSLSTSEGREDAYFDLVQRTTGSDLETGLTEPTGLNRPGANSPSSDDIGGREALVVSGECLRMCIGDEVLEPLFVAMMQRCYTTVCTRMTPKQKATVTKLVKKEFGKICLSVGDGANDVSMIREADVGVGIFGKEGSQAVNSADFALHKFADLRQLLFVHGANCHLRIVCAARASLFTNLSFNLPQLWFQLVCAYSGQAAALANVLAAVNLAITSYFLIAICTLDRDLLPEDLLANPRFYEPKLVSFRIKDFLVEISLAVWLSIVAFFFAFYALPAVWVPSGLVSGFLSQATLFTVIIVSSILLSLTLRFRVFTTPHVTAVVLGNAMLWIVAVGAPALDYPEGTDNRYVPEYVGQSAAFFLVFVCAQIMCVLPYFVGKAWHALFRPAQMQVFREAKFVEDKL